MKQWSFDVRSWGQTRPPLEEGNERTWKNYVICSLRLCWTACLNTLQDFSDFVQTEQAINIQLDQHGCPAAC
jgi:hypothetical protein